MRHIDWLSVLTDAGVNFVERGANVKRGEINIKCPFCGSADPSEHMGLSLETGWWACWRNAQHRGKSPVRLLMVLLRISFGSAREMAGLGDDYIDPEGFTSLRARLEGLLQPQQVEVKPPLTLPADFKPIRNSGSSRRHWRYLVDRDFDERDIRQLVDDYALSYTVRGDQAHRIIIPYILDGAVITWTGRAIAPSSARYLDQPLDEATTPVKHTLYNHDAMAEGGEALLLVEGPMDVLKVDFYGRDVGVRAVGLSTSSISEAQAHLLGAGAKKFRRRIVMGDQKASGLGIVDSMRLRQQLGFIAGVEAMVPPYNLKDTGAMTPAQAIQFTNTLGRT